ncbi:MAG: transketolase family protein [Lachnotalea sp.]
MLNYNKKNIRAWSMLGGCGTFGQVASEIAKEDNDFAVVTADLTFFSGLERLKLQKPDAVYNFGIAEQNMVGAAAGMTKEGMNVFATTYASFASTRCLDQVRVNMGYMKLPVKLVGLTAGYSVGILGATHMAMEDIAIMRSIPNIVILSPADCTETAKSIVAAYNCKNPVYIRLTGEQRNPIVYNEDYEFTIGKSIQLADGDDIALLATGTMVYECLQAKKILECQGLSCKVIDFHTIKPLDEEMLESLKKMKLIVTVEEHSKIGGLGSAVAEFFANKIVRAPHLIIGAEDAYPHAANYKTLLRNCGLNNETISKRVFNHYRNCYNL